jgi:hypothetical protein
MSIYIYIYCVSRKKQKLATRSHGDTSEATVNTSSCAVATPLFLYVNPV